ncbi:MAG: toxin-antitoxin system YwqK family antitoxin, partial [Luteibaculum sp.]
IYDAKGNLSRIVPYQNDSITGVVEEYFPNGKIKQKTPYEQNLKDGQARIYAEDGRVIWLIQYEKDAVVNREAINRYAEDSLKTGLWMEFHPNEVKKLVGSYVRNQKDGIFKEYDENGKLLNIYEYNNGALVDNATALNVIDQEKFYYPNGQVKRIETRRGDKKQGFTQTFDEKGNVILSQIFRNDTLIAEGNQNELGQKIGLWKYYWPNGNLESTGYYKAGRKDGSWKYYFESGELEQEGFWKNDKPDKEWIWYFKDGKQRCIMHFEDGKEDGDYIEYDQYNYVVAEGKYSEGYKVGEWYYSGGDQVEVGRYRDGLKDGDWKYYYYEQEPESLIFEGGFRDGAPNGIHIYYYQQNIPRFIWSYKAGLKNGEFIWFYDDGTRKYSLTYELDELKSVNGVPFKEIGEEL